MFQENVDSFTVSATKCARRMATFVKILNKEDISTMDNRDNIREVTARFSILSHFLVVSSNKEGICTAVIIIFVFRKSAVGAFNKECPPPNFVTISRNFVDTSSKQRLWVLSRITLPC